MDSLAKTLIIVGLSLAALGGLLLLASRLGMPKLPGDVLVRRGNFVLYMPLGLMLLLSVLLTVFLNLVHRR